MLGEFDWSGRKLRFWVQSFSGFTTAEKWIYALRYVARTGPAKAEDPVSISFLITSNPKVRHPFLCPPIHPPILHQISLIKLPEPPIRPYNRTAALT